jgi:hypothetical protein
MSNIVDRLRDRAYSTKAGDPLCEEAAALIECLEWRDKTRLNVIARLTQDNERLRNGAATSCGTVTLTDQEREAVETAMDGYIAWMEDNSALEKPCVQENLATLRSLINRP